MNEHEFFEVLGYLTNPNRQCKLDAEMHPRSQHNFESRYIELTGHAPQPDDHNYYILHKGADKWGLELRVYFVSASDNIPRAIQNMVVSPRPATIYNCRINDNNLIWRLIENGILLSDIQDEGRIRNMVPEQHSTDFNRGYQLP